MQVDGVVDLATVPAAPQNKACFQMTPSPLGIPLGIKAMALPWEDPEVRRLQRLRGGWRDWGAREQGTSCPLNLHLISLQQELFWLPGQAEGERDPPPNSSELRTHHTMEFEKTNVFFLNISWVYVLVKILQRNRTNRVYILCVCLCEGREREGERLIIRNWPTHFWRLRSPSICSWQAGNLGEPVV